ncbi:MAG: M1 family peptidase, partial [Gloeobacteraceae cyanobacterium ES-bin-316]|nr:M1 family peptidase [Ferruginibacter sp.]
MEDASAVDLDWFWRGWFYGTEAVDISLDSVKCSVVDTETPAPKPNAGGTTSVPVGKPILNAFEDISKIRNREDKKIVFAVDADTSLRDFYWRYARDMAKVDPTPHSITRAEGIVDTFTTAEKTNLAGSKYLYELTFSNKGGLVMPIIVEFTFKDGTKETDKMDAQIWRKNENKVIKTFMKNKEVASIKLDPMKETADIDEKNNGWNTDNTPSKFQLFKARARAVRGAGGGTNPMQKEIK